MNVLLSPVMALVFGILACSPASASGKPSSHHRAAPQAAGMDLFSRRARRRVATILQLRLLELRKERLDAIRRVIERRLSIDRLFASPPPTP